MATAGSLRNPGLDFIISSLLGVMSRIGEIFLSAPTIFIDRFKFYLDTFNVLMLANPGQVIVWTTGFANVPLDTVNLLVAQIARIPADVLINEARKRISIPIELRTKAMSADKAVIMCFDFVAQAGFRAAKGELPNVFTLWQRADTIKGTVTRTIKGTPFAGYFKKLVLKGWLLLVNVYIAMWNILCTGFTLLVFASMLERVGTGIVSNYTFRQTNPLVRDRSLGRRRQRV